MNEEKQPSAEETVMQDTEETKKRNIFRKISGSEGKIDYMLVLGVVVLTCFGLLMLYSTSYYTAQLKNNDKTYYLFNQGWKDMLGLVFMLVMSLISYKFWFKFTWWAYMIAIVLMVLVDFTPLGMTVNGSTRWLKVTSELSFQPTEFVKIAVIAVMAYTLWKYRKSRQQSKRVNIALGMLVLPIGLVCIKNLSSAIILCGIALLMALIGGRQKKWPLIIIASGVVCVILMIVFSDQIVELGLLKDYQMERILVYKNPSAYAQDGGYQVLQGLYAIGSGGLWGKGLGNSTQKLGFVPEAQNDMIFSIIVEELGIFGAVCLLALYAIVIYRIISIAGSAEKSGNLLGTFMAMGVGVHIALQVVLNVAVVLGLIPNTGVSLPFVSFGGSSVIFLYFEIGVVLNVARYGNEARELRREKYQERLKARRKESEETEAEAQTEP